MFVVSEVMEWIDNSEMNVVMGEYLHTDLTLKRLPLENMNEQEIEVVEPYIQWFDETKFGEKFAWKVKALQKLCQGCGSEGCLYHKDPVGINKILNALLEDYKLTCKQKRYIAYQQAIKDV